MKIYASTSSYKGSALTNPESQISLSEIPAKQNTCRIGQVRLEVLWDRV